MCHCLLEMRENGNSLQKQHPFVPFISMCFNYENNIQLRDE